MGLIGPQFITHPRLRQGVLALGLGVVIFGGVYLVDRTGPQSTATSITAPEVAGAQPPRVGHPAADFQLLSPDGQPVSLGQYTGRPVWINFWASWCPPCRAEFPDMEAVYQEYQETGLVLLAVSFAESPEDVRNYLAMTRPSFTVVVDPPGQVAGQYRVMGLPTHVYVDREGIVRDIRVGPMNQALMREKLASIVPAPR